MTVKGSHHSRRLDRSLADALVESYAAWCEAAGVVRDVYGTWADAGARDPDAFYRFNAALDQEERAARKYQELVGRLNPGVFAPSRE